MTPVKMPPEAIAELVEQSRLSLYEKKEMELFIVRGMPNLQFYPKEEMLEKYLQGYEPIELLRIFKDQDYTLGGILYLKSTGNWLQKKEEFLRDLEHQTNIKFLQTKFSSVSAMSSLLDVFSKKMVSSIHDYLQTGNIEALPAELQIKNFKDFKGVIRILAELNNINLVPNESPQSADKRNPKVAISANTVNFVDSNKPNDKTQQSLNVLKSIYEGVKDPKE